MKLLPVVPFLFASFAAVAIADTVNTYGAVTVVTGPNSQPAWQITSDPAGLGYGGVYIGFTGVVTPAMLSSVSADYVMTEGTFGGGAPRFSLIDNTGNEASPPPDEAYDYWGTPLGGGTFTDPNLGSTTLHNTGNLVSLTSTDLRVASNGFSGYGNGNTYETYKNFLTETGARGAVSSAPMTYLSLDVDGGFSSAQQVDVENFSVTFANGTTETFNPSQTAPTPEPRFVSLFAAGCFLIFGLYKRNRVS
jgi:hypothetical protein